MISEGEEILKFIRNRNEAIDERNEDGVIVDAHDSALYDIPETEEYHGKVLTSRFIFRRVFK